MTITVEVTQRHIDEGRRGTCACCPVALALDEATGLKWMVFIEEPIAVTYYARCYDDVSGAKIALPKSACRFVSDFDDRTPVQPFSFDLDLPPAIVAAMKDKVKA